MIHILYNPIAKNGHGIDDAHTIEEIFKGETFKYESLLEIGDPFKFISGIPADEKVVLTGGDGTINHFVNDIAGRKLTRELYYSPAGTGNDFWKDIKGDETLGVVLLNPYLEKLPTVTVKGKTSYFINGVGFGIDGYCCEKADEIREKTDKPANYTAIAIKGLLYDFKPRKATVEVDGVVTEKDHVWLVPVMNGRFYGGGMMVTPGQDRLNKERTVSCVILHCKFNLHALMIFPKIFKGELINEKKHVCLFTGKHVKVKFDKPCALQIDGETILNVSECEINAYQE